METEELTPNLDNAVDKNKLLFERDNLDGLCTVEANDLPFQVFSKDYSRGEK